MTTRAAGFQWEWDAGAAEWVKAYMDAETGHYWRARVYRGTQPGQRLPVYGWEVTLDGTVYGGGWTVWGVDEAMKKAEETLG